AGSGYASWRPGASVRGGWLCAGSRLGLLVGIGPAHWAVRPRAIVVVLPASVHAAAAVRPAPAMHPAAAAMHAHAHSALDQLPALRRVEYGEQVEMRVDAVLEQLALQLGHAPRLGAHRGRVQTRGGNELVHP